MIIVSLRENLIQYYQLIFFLKKIVLVVKQFEIQFRNQQNFLLQILNFLYQNFYQILTLNKIFLQQLHGISSLILRSFHQKKFNKELYE